MSLILCPPNTAATFIQRRIKQGYSGLCSAIASEQVGHGLAGFFPAWKGSGPEGKCAVVATTAYPMDYVAACNWMRDALDGQQSADLETGDASALVEFE